MHTPLTMDTGTIVAVTILLGMYYLYLKSKEQ